MNREWTYRSVLMSSAFILNMVGSCPAFANSVNFSTGDFPSNEWFSEIIPGLVGTSSASTQTTDGNPGAFRRVSLTVGPNESAFDAELWNVARFTPSTQGKVTSVSMSYDISRVFSSNPGATQVAKGIAVLQDGILSTAFLGVSTVSPPIWEGVSVADLVPLFPTVNWVDGNPITFGFYNSVSTGVLGFTIDAGFDNFAVAVNFSPVPAPLPMSLLFLVSGIGALMPQKFRKTNRG